jgi:hypothetical protein
MDGWNLKSKTSRVLDGGEVGDLDAHGDALLLLGLGLLGEELVEEVEIGWLAARSMDANHARGCRRSAFACPRRDRRLWLAAQDSLDAHLLRDR